MATEGFGWPIFGALSKVPIPAKARLVKHMNATTVDGEEETGDGHALDGLFSKY
jgi:hypothetical protein